MRFLPLVWHNLLRRKARTIFTLLSIVVAFVLFGLLGAIRVAFGMGVEVAGADRLLTMHKVTFTQVLPESYGARIAATAGVLDLSYSTWFGGIYQHPRNFFPQFAVDPESWLRLYPELVVPEAQKKAWLANRIGALVGRRTADRFGWTLGDRIPLQGTIWRTAHSDTWEFVIEGVYDAPQGFDTSQFFFHHKYLTEGRTFGEGFLGWYVVKIADPAGAAEVAARIDAQFANSPAETKTSTEQAFFQAFANQVGDIGTMLSAILAAVFFTLLLVVGNTMAQAVRERTNELAVLKTLGFSDGLVLSLVLLESCALALLGGAIGLALSWMIVARGDPTGGFLAVFYIPLPYLAIGALLVVLLGLATGMAPAVRANRLRIADALRKS